MTAPLAIGGSRLTWTELPPHVREAVEAAAGAPVRSETSQPGGFSPGLASVLQLADGRSVFVKAVNAARNPHSPGFFRREAGVLAALPATVPAPRLLWTYDDGDWVALMTEAIAGRPPAQPWQPAELDVFLDTVAGLAVQLTPAPIDAPRFRDSHADTFTGWRSLAGEPGGADHIDPWARQRLERLAELEQSWPHTTDGSTLLHADMRADNVLLTGNGAVFVDWPGACIGAAWVELLLALPSIVMHGGGDPEQLWRRYPPAAEADPEAVTVILTAAAGYFVHRAGLPPPPGLPRVRAFQRAQGEAALAWLRRRLH